MTEDQTREMKILCYANWLITRKLKSEPGVRDLNSLKNVVSLPGGGSLVCFLGEKLTNRRDLYSQLGWFIYHTIDGEPFRSKNRSTALIMTIWALRHYQLEFDRVALKEFIKNLDPLKQGNSDISIWFQNNCR